MASLDEGYMGGGRSGGRELGISVSRALNIKRQNKNVPSITDLYTMFHHDTSNITPKRNVSTVPGSNALNIEDRTGHLSLPRSTYGVPILCTVGRTFASAEARVPGHASPSVRSVQSGQSPVSAEASLSGASAGTERARSARQAPVAGQASGSFVETRLTGPALRQRSGSAVRVVRA